MKMREKVERWICKKMFRVVRMFIKNKTKLSILNYQYADVSGFYSKDWLSVEGLTFWYFYLG